jgi:hypothetical protein
MDLRKNVGPGNYCTGFTPEQCQLLDNCNNSWGKEFLKHMIVCFRNYIQKGGDALLQGSDMFSTPMMRVVFQMATGCAGDDDESDTNAVISLFITLIENYKGRIDHLVEPILQLALANL